jgi:hypothetical protein
MNPPSLDEFIAAAKEFCAFAQNDQRIRIDDLWKVRELLVRLIYHITAVDEAPQGCDHDGERPTQAEHVRVIQKCSEFPFNFYQVVFDPHDFETQDEPVTGMLADDLADIYRDLAEGLDNASKGHLEEAYFDWSQSYQSHWARHAVNALAAIEIYRTDQCIPIKPTPPD